MLPDHPRSRGEYSKTMSRDLPEPGSSPLSRGIPPAEWLRRGVLGSSPLSRGIPLVILPYLVAGGIIPALAGNTPLCRPL